MTHYMRDTSGSKLMLPLSPSDMNNLNNSHDIHPDQCSKGMSSSSKQSASAKEKIDKQQLSKVKSNRNTHDSGIQEGNREDKLKKEHQSGSIITSPSVPQFNQSYGIQNTSQISSFSSQYPGIPQGSTSQNLLNQNGENNILPPQIPFFVDPALFPGFTYHPNPSVDASLKQTLGNDDFYYFPDNSSRINNQGISSTGPNGNHNQNPQSEISTYNSPGMVNNPLNYMRKADSNEWKSSTTKSSTSQPYSPFPYNGSSYPKGIPPKNNFPVTFLDNNNQSNGIQEQGNGQNSSLGSPYGQQQQQRLKISDFKVHECTKKEKHEKKKCPYFHSDGDRRRCPITFQYSFNECKKKDKCPLKDQCPQVHNKVEQLYHPLRYKAKFCKSYKENNQKCDYGNFCSFAHQESEIMIPMISKLNKDPIFYMYFYKTVWCPNTSQHERADCPYMHNVQDFRRDPKNYQLEPKQCEQWKKSSIQKYSEGECPKQLSCKNCHGWKELDYHPQVYKTKPCNIENCPQNLECVLYHSDSDHRVNNYDVQLGAPIDVFFNEIEQKATLNYNPVVNNNSLNKNHHNNNNNNNNSRVKTQSSNMIYQQQQHQNNNIRLNQNQGNSFGMVNQFQNNQKNNGNTNNSRPNFQKNMSQNNNGFRGNKNNSNQQNFTYQTIVPIQQVDNYQNNYQNMFQMGNDYQQNTNNSYAYNNPNQNNYNQISYSAQSAKNTNKQQARNGNSNSSNGISNYNTFYTPQQNQSSSTSSSQQKNPQPNIAAFSQIPQVERGFQPNLQAVVDSSTGDLLEMGSVSSYKSSSKTSSKGAYSRDSSTGKNDDQSSKTLPNSNIYPLNDITPDDIAFKLIRLNNNLQQSSQFNDDVLNLSRKNNNLQQQSQFNDDVLNLSRNNNNMQQSSQFNEDVLNLSRKNTNLQQSSQFNDDVLNLSRKNSCSELQKCFDKKKQAELYELLVKHHFTEDKIKRLSSIDIQNLSFLSCVQKRSLESILSNFLDDQDIQNLCNNIDHNESKAFFRLPCITH